MELLEKIVLHIGQPLLLNNRSWRVSKQACRAFFKYLTFRGLLQIPQDFLIPAVIYFQATHPESNKLQLCLDRFVTESMRRNSDGDSDDDFDVNEEGDASDSEGSDGE